MSYALGGRVAEQTRYEPIEDAFDCEYLPLDSITDDDLFDKAMTYWNRLRGERWAPSRNDLDPAAIQPLLPYMALIDVDPSDQRFSYRLAGTSACRTHGVELTGTWVDELEPATFATELQTQLRQLLTERVPHMVRWRFINRELERRESQVLRLPLSSDGVRVDKIFCLADHWRQPGPICMLRLKQPN